MKLYAPEYYKNFKCIADKCDHSCCVGWEIDIDSRTLQKYTQLKADYAQSIINSITGEDYPHFGLCADDRCPHLDENGLCRIILNVGEEYLCDICREHPRFYNYTDTAEVGLGMSCREAARMILSSPNYDVMEPIGESDATADADSFNGRSERDRIYKVLKSEGQEYKTKLVALYSAYKIEVGSDEDWLELIDSLEYLDEAHKRLFMNYSSSKRPVGKDEYLERALAYFIYRHLTESFDEYELCVRLAFCLFLERLLASLICAENADSVEAIARLASLISEEIEYSEDNTELLMGSC